MTFNPTERLGGLDRRFEVRPARYVTLDERRLRVRFLVDPLVCRRTAFARFGL
jgi:hypothetical protein